MAWAYRAGTSAYLPVGRIVVAAHDYAPGVIIGNDGSFVLRDAEGLFGTPDIRQDFHPITQQPGEWPSSAYYNGRHYEIVAAVFPGVDNCTLGLVADLGAALDYLKSNFNLASQNLFPITAQSADWGQARLANIRADGPVTITPKDGAHRAPWRTVTIPVHQPDPLLYSTTQHNVTVPVSGSVAVPNVGDLPVGFIWVVQGPINNAQISDGLGHSIAINAVIPAGLSVTVDTKLRTAKRSDGVEMYNALTGFSFVTIPPGSITVTGSGSGTSGATALNIFYRDAWS